MGAKNADVFGAFLRETGRLVGLQQPGGPDLPLPTEGQTNAIATAGATPAAHTFDGSGRLLTRTAGGVTVSIDWTDPIRPVLTNNKGAAPLRLVLDAQGRYLSREFVSAPAPSPAPAPAPGPAPAPADWRASLALYTYTQVPGSTLAGSPAGVGSLPGDNTSQAARLLAFSGITKRGGKIYLICTGGHQDSPDNGARVLDVDTASPGWSLLVPSSWNGSEQLTPYYASGKPASRHAYRTIHWVPQRSRFIMGGARYVWGAPGTSFPNVSGFNPDAVPPAFDPSNTWTDSLASLCAFDPVSGVGLGIRPNSGGQLAKWVAATDTWTQPAPAPAYVSTAAFDSLRNQWFCLDWGDGASGGSQVNAFKVDGPITGAVPITLTGPGLSAFVSAAATDATMVNDPNNDCFWFWEGRTRQLFKVTPNNTTTWPIDVQSLAGALPPVADANFSRAEFVALTGGKAGLFLLPGGHVPGYFVRTF